jgi:hypothetical protein
VIENLSSWFHRREISSLPFHAAFSGGLPDPLDLKTL